MMMRNCRPPIRLVANHQLFGILPIGILGVFGYVSILATWWVTRMGHVRLVKIAWAVLSGMVLFGVLFSTYLTFLEPFVIGATCIWCLTSAVIMLLLLGPTMLSTPQGASMPEQAAATRTSAFLTRMRGG
jgi:uncharacterized membrane protein